MQTQSLFLFGAKFESAFVKALRQSIKKTIDAVEGRQGVFLDQCIRDRGIFEEINIKIHRGSIVNELVQGLRRVFLFIILPEQIFQFRLESRSIPSFVAG